MKFTKREEELFKAAYRVSLDDFYKEIFRYADNLVSVMKKRGELESFYSIDDLYQFAEEGMYHRISQLADEYNGKESALKSARHILNENE